MARPTDLPAWAITDTVDVTTGQHNRVEPSGGKKDTGFTHNEKPPRQDINWLFWHLAEWTTYFDGLIDQNVKVAGTPTFAGVTSASVTVGTLNPGAGALAIKGVTTWKDSSNVIKASINPTTGAALFGATEIDGGITLGGSATGITGAELETLSGGAASNADALHTHSYPSYGSITLFVPGGYAFRTVATKIPIGDGGEGIHFGDIVSDLANNRVTVSKDGIYKVSFDVQINKVGSSAESPIVQLYKSGVAYQQPSTAQYFRSYGSSLAQPNALATTSAHMSSIFELAEGDYLELYGIHNTATDCYIHAASLIVEQMRKL